MVTGHLRDGRQPDDHRREDVGRDIGRQPESHRRPAARLDIQPVCGDLQAGELRPITHVLLFQAFVPSEIPGYVLGTLHYRFCWYVVALAITELPYAVVTVYLGESYLRGNRLIFISLGSLVVIAALVAGRIIG